MFINHRNPPQLNSQYAVVVKK